MPLDDVAYRYADALIARGALRSVSVLERPYTARALAVAADSVLVEETSPVVRSYAVALRNAVNRYGEPGDTARASASRDSVRLIGMERGFATGQTSGVRELTRADTSSSVTGGADMRLAMLAGPFVATSRGRVDNQLKQDPEFAGRKDRAVAGRLDEGYFGGQWKYAQLVFGRVGRNWGPYPVEGLAVSAYPYSYDHLYARLGTERLHVSSIAAKLDDDFEPDGVHQRYLYSHRIGGAWRGVEAGLSEGYLATGVGRSYDLSLLNPLNIYALSWRNEKVDGNLNLGGDLAVRTRAGVYAAELFLDDLQIDTCAERCSEPASYGVTLTAEGVPVVGDQRAFASYTRLTSLAYRTPLPAERYASFGVGLGRGATDYDEARVGVDLAVVPWTTLRMYGAYRRQGEGDYRLPYPDTAAYASTPGFLIGTVTRTTRVAVSGAAVALSGLEVTGDLGYNWVRNAGHVSGRRRNGGEGRVRVQWAFPTWGVGL